MTQQASTVPQLPYTLLQSWTAWLPLTLVAGIMRQSITEALSEKLPDELVEDAVTTACERAAAIHAQLGPLINTHCFDGPVLHVCSVECLDIPRRTKRALRRISIDGFRTVSTIGDLLAVIRQGELRDAADIGPRTETLLLTLLAQHGFHVPGRHHAPAQPPASSE